MRIILLFITCLISTSVKAQTDIFETKSVVQAEYNQSSPTTGEMLLTIKDGWHVNAHPASMDFLIPVDIALSQTPEPLDASYPTGHAIETPLGDLMVYSGRVSIPVVLKQEQKSGSISLTAQACDGNTCYPPSTWNFPLETLKAE